VSLQESAGDADGALQLMEEVLRVRRRVWGDQDPDTLDSITNLALHHLEMRNYAAALPLSEEAVASIRATVASQSGEGEGEEGSEEGEHGSFHTAEAGHAIISLAAIHGAMGNFARSKPLHEEALQMRRELLGEEHLDTLNSKHGLGQTLVGLGQHEEGMAMLVLCVATAKRVFGEAHPSTQHFCKGLADATATVGSV
jgi:tetratricopeptide (TPR) repeat protein